MPLFEADGTAYAERIDNGQVICVQAELLARKDLFIPLDTNNPKVLEAKIMGTVEYQNGLVPYHKMVKAVYATCLTGQHTYDAMGHNLNIFGTNHASASPLVPPNNIYICETQDQCPFCKQDEAKMLQTIEADQEVSLTELARFTGLSVEYLCILIKREKLPIGRKVGRTRRIHLQEAINSLKVNGIKFTGNQAS